MSKETITTKPGWNYRDHPVIKVYRGKDRIGLIYRDMDAASLFDWTPTDHGLARYPELRRVKQFAGSVGELVDSVRNAMKGA